MYINLKVKVMIKIRRAETDHRDIPACLTRLEMRVIVFSCININIYGNIYMLFAIPQFLKPTQLSNETY